MSLLLLLVACSVDAAPGARPPPGGKSSAPVVVAPEKSPAPIPEAGPGHAVAVFAGGCFWCLESDFDKLEGIVHTTSGYAGGHLANPTYSDVTSETSGHKEVVRVVYDTRVLTYDQVLDYFWHHIDPIDTGGQFCDRGDSYESAVYTADDAQKTAAFASKAALDGRKVLASAIATPILPLERFYAAENYHQDFHEKNPGRYLSYRLGCGRDLRVAEVWANEK